ncbi:glycoside hydrolase family 127 protein, partial [Escherichia coli]|uniref:beta-L-arabinofuranosidase domain-containing protein n=1 Tax=Escherichia coli TaxID=562 RepID=UPI00211765BE
HDDSKRQDCQRLWNNMDQRQLYINGGICSQSSGEAFSSDYDLPNDTVYAESCASIGLMMFARRMLEMEGDSQYADVMERALYNTVLGGMALDG